VTISCPSCRTRYRYPQIAAGASGQACCAQCAAEFPLAPDRPAYRVLATAAPAEPSVATAPRSSLTLPPPELPQVTLPPLAAPESAQPVPEEQPADTPVAESSPAEAPDTPKAAEPAPVSARASQRSGTLRGLLLTLLLASAGWASGYHLSLTRGADLLTWTAAGAGIGLILGWMVIRWLGSRHDRHEAAGAGTE